jgi:hypothetical protein
VQQRSSAGNFFANLRDTCGSVREAFMTAIFQSPVGKCPAGGVQSGFGADAGPCCPSPGIILSKRAKVGSFGADGEKACVKLLVFNKIDKL